MTRRRLVVVSGLSGAGKTVALHALEEEGYYCDCVDNLPIGILQPFVIYMADQDGADHYQVAVGIDARNHHAAIQELPESLDGLNSDRVATELVTDIEAFLRKWIPGFEEENRKCLTVAFGCTGGRHRSVYMSERIAKRFMQMGKKSVISH